MEKKKSNRNNIIAGIVLLAIIAAVVYFVVNPAETAEKKASEDNVSSEISLEYYIVDVDCDNCFDLEKAVEFLKTLPGIKMEMVDAESDAVKKYDIKKLPTLVLKGNIDRLDVPEFEKVGDVLVLRDVPAPFVDTDTNEIRGIVELTVVEKEDCKECFDVAKITDNLEKMSVYIKDAKKFNYSSEEGRQLVEKYDIKRLPALIFNRELLAYTPIRNVWNSSGTVEADGMLVVREVTPPFYSIETGDVRGLVDLIILADESCTECYDYNIHKVMMQSQFMMEFSSEKVVDVSSEEGKALVEKYDIELVPTMLLSEEAAIYPLIPEVWSRIGTVEADGVFVLRALNMVDGIKFRNLTSGEVVASAGS